MGFWNRLFAKRDSVPKQLRPIFERMRREEEGRKLADQAISYRNVGNFDKAIELLMRALAEFGYEPAIILIGTTSLKKGNVGEAVRWFELQINEKQKRDDFPLIELYANLGSIYHNYYKNDAKALKMYTMAIEAPRPPIFEKHAYSLMESSVYHDMAVIYINLDDTFGAHACAKKCVRLRPDCVVCSNVVDNVMVGVDRVGKPIAAVIREESGKNRMVTVEKQPNSLWYCLALISAQSLQPGDRGTFSRWAGLPVNEWTSSHIERCALAMMHYFCTAHEFGLPVPNAVRIAHRFLKREQLPPLENQLSKEVINVFSRISGGTA